MKFVPVLSLCLIVAASAVSRPVFADDSRYSLRVSREEARESLLGLLDDEAERGALTPEADAHVMELVRSYRTQSGAAALALKDAPFIPLVVREKTAELYPSAYQSAHHDQYDAIVVHPKLEFLLDQLLDGYVNGSLPADIARQAGALGATLARKVIRGKGTSCALDESDHVDKPGFFKMLWVKITQFTDWPVSPCSARVTVFDYVKQDLIDARNNHVLGPIFEQRFPPEFRDEFLKQLAQQKQGFGELVSKKFKGDLDAALWGPNTALVETEDGAPGQVSLRGFASGIRADLAAAARLVRLADPKPRGMAGPLFYAAANRLLLLTGGKEAQWNGSEFAVVPGVSGVTGATGGVSPQLCASQPQHDGCAHHYFDSQHPDAAPVYAFDIFGGWGLEKGANGAAFSPWDWGGYDPTRTLNPTPLRIFPSTLLLGDRGRPLATARDAQGYETLGDLADLLHAVTDFLKATRPDGPFGANFGDASALSSLLDPNSPILFPRDGRMLAVGIMAGVLKNLIAPGVGHIEVTDPGTAEGGLGIAFHDQVTLNGRDTEGASVRGVAKVLMAAADLRDSMTGDPDVPAELQAYGPQLDQAEQIGALTLAAQGQGPDGGFFERLRTPMTTGRGLGTNITGLRSLTRAYRASQMLVLRLSIKSSWQFLDRFWGSPALPSPNEGVGGQPVNPSDLWSLIRLWDETQQYVRPDLATDIDWAKWENRVNSLRQKLLEQLRGEHGPEPLGDMPS